MKKGEVVRIELGMQAVVVRNHPLSTGCSDFHVEVEARDGEKPALLSMTPLEAKKLAEALEYAWNFSQEGV